MSVLSFSTMWAQQDRFAHDWPAFRRLVAGFGYEAIEVSHSTGQLGLEALLTPGELPLSSLHAPTPYHRLADGRANADANLAALDEDERRAAVADTQRTLDFAADAGLSRVVLHLGHVGDLTTLVRDPTGYMAEPERRLRLLVQAGEMAGEQVETVRDELRRWRAPRADAHLTAARRSLQELVDYAASGGVAIGLESRLHYNEIPHPAEALALLADYPDDIAGYWHDVGHCEVQARLGLIDRDAWFPALTARTIGCHLHDVEGLVDHRAPGHGDVDWGYIAAGLPPDALRVYEINQHEPDELVAAAIGYLRQRGVVD